MKNFYLAAADILSRVLAEPAENLLSQLIKPPKPEMGDIGFPCFNIAKTRHQDPKAVASTLASQIVIKEPFSSCKAIGPYLNFVISTKSLSDITAEAVSNPNMWGKSDEGKDKTVIIDYSSPNIAKPLGVHHIRSTIIGAALARLYESCGWKVIKINHLGDWGTNFGQIMVSYKKAEQENPDVPVDIESLISMYIRFHDEADKDDSLNDEARAWFKKLEEGDHEAVHLWKLTVEESLKSLKKLYSRLGIEFDHYTGESFFNGKMNQTIESLEQKGLLKLSDGATVVDLEEHKMPPCIIKKTDGATTYATRDLTAAEYRHATYNFDKCLYVVANQQDLHFKQVFKVLELAGNTWASNCEHVKFGMLSFGKGVFGEEKTLASTRKGHVVFLEDVLDQAVEKSKTLTCEKTECDVDDKKLAEQIGIGAVIFNEFLQRRHNDVCFTWEKALNMQGDSGPYLQYTHARLLSIKNLFVQKFKTEPKTNEVNWELLKSQLERNVLLKIAEFKPYIEQALNENEPSLIVDYMLDLCSVFNRMFTDKENHRIITDDLSLSVARISLAEAVRITLANGLKLLGLAAPEHM